MYTENTTIGFIGLGVMGEPICRNMATRSGRQVVAFDLRREPLERLAASSVTGAADIADLVNRADTIVLSLPGGDQLQEVVQGAGGILEHVRAGMTVVNTTTAPAPPPWKAL